MIRSPIEFGDVYVGEPEPPRWPWARAIVAAFLVFVALPTVVGIVIAGLTLAAQGSP
jgi:hypothetical protein